LSKSPSKNCTPSHTGASHHVSLVTLGPHEAVCPHGPSYLQYGELSFAHCSWLGPWIYCHSNMRNALETTTIIPHKPTTKFRLPFGLWSVYLNSSYSAVSSSASRRRSYGALRLLLDGILFRMSEILGRNMFKNIGQAKIRGCSIEKSFLNSGGTTLKGGRCFVLVRKQHHPGRVSGSKTGSYDMALLSPTSRYGQR